ncbi:MAG: methionine--tRNA ligase subunit beta [Candidatus Wildermuthbacteria bacterium]|nr:methionine--tRNA ligase subunit beta [Candidatus Wildermuthbacteria bacterium]
MNKPIISYEDFQKLELKIAHIRQAERIEGSEKLLKLHVSIGEEQRQIVAGIGLAYTPETLIGKAIVLVANLAPRVIKGVESQGMLLAASDELPVLLVPERIVPPGSEIK